LLRAELFLGTEHQSGGQVYWIWRSCWRWARIDAERPVIIDIDATLVTAHSD
jgi:hypothetical protein